MVPTKHPLLLEDPAGLRLGFSELYNNPLLTLSIQQTYKPRDSIFLLVLGEQINIYGSSSAFLVPYAELLCP